MRINLHMISASPSWSIHAREGFFLEQRMKLHIFSETFDKMTSFSKGIFSTIFSAEYHIFPVTLDHGNRV